MSKEDIVQFLKVLKTIEGKCPHELGVGESTKHNCGYDECADCWMHSLEKALNK